MTFSWAVCRCFFEKNIFIPELGHLEFKGRHYFESKYAKVLQKVDKNKVIADIEQEVGRRRNICEETRRNVLEIQTKYSPLNSQLFLSESFLSLPSTIQGMLCIISFVKSMV